MKHNSNTSKWNLLPNVFFFGPQYCCLESVSKQPLVTLMKLRCSVWLLSHHRTQPSNWVGGHHQEAWSGSGVRCIADSWTSGRANMKRLSAWVPQSILEKIGLFYTDIHTCPQISLPFFLRPLSMFLFFFTLMYILTFRPSGWLSGIGLSTYPELSNLLT